MIERDESIKLPVLTGAWMTQAIRKEKGTPFLPILNQIGRKKYLGIQQGYLRLSGNSEAGFVLEIDDIDD